MKKAGVPEDLSALSKEELISLVNGLSSERDDLQAACRALARQHFMSTERELRAPLEAARCDALKLKLRVQELERRNHELEQRDRASSSSESVTGLGNPVMGDSERCKVCGSWMDYACEDVYVCIGCEGEGGDDGAYEDYEMVASRWVDEDEMVAAAEAHEAQMRTLPETEELEARQQSQHLANSHEYLVSLSWQMLH